MMIWVAILFLISSAAYKMEERGLINTTTLHPDTLVKRYQMECIEETRVDPDTIIKIKSQNWNMHYDRLQLVKDWALCVLMKTGVMTAQGVYRIDVALQRVPVHERYNVQMQIDACLTPKPMPARDIAYKFVKCFQRMNNKSEFSSIVSAF